MTTLPMRHRDPLGNQLDCWILFQSSNDFVGPAFPRWAGGTPPLVAVETGLTCFSSIASVVHNSLTIPLRDACSPFARLQSAFPCLAASVSGLPFVLASAFLRPLFGGVSLQTDFLSRR